MYDKLNGIKKHIEKSKADIVEIGEVRYTRYDDLEERGWISTNKPDENNLGIAVKHKNDNKIVKIHNIFLGILGLTLHAKANTNITMTFACAPGHDHSVQTFQLLLKNLQPLIDAYDNIMMMGDLNSEEKRNYDEIPGNYGLCHYNCRNGT